MAYVYRHIRNDINEVFYIGIGSDNEGKYKRAKTKDRGNPLWKNIVKKVEYRIEIIFDDISWEEACNKEKEFIRLYGRRDLGLGTLVNMTDGGDGSLGVIISEDTRNKLRGPKSEETRKKMSESQKGKTYSESTLEKFRRPKNYSESTLEKFRRPKSEDTLEKFKKPKSEEHRLNISKARTGKKANIVICPHCQKEGGDNTMKRWHFDNCKIKTKLNK